MNHLAGLQSYVQLPSECMHTMSYLSARLKQALRCCVAVVSLLFGSAAAAAPRCVTILATSDVHGNLAPEHIEAKDGQGAVLAGGVLAMSGYVAAMRQEREILLLDAGDLFQGTMAVNQSRGAAIIDAYNALGYDAAAIGNHEFDYGPDPKRPGSPTGSLEAAIARAKFPFLAANIEDRASHALPLWQGLRASLALTRAGIRIGVIGISTPTTPSATLVTNVRDLSFAAAHGAIVREAARLRAAGAELVVLIAHMGGRCRSTDDAFDRSTCEVGEGRYGELVAVLQGLPRRAVDVVVGGHTHEQMAHWFGDTAVIQSGAYGRFFGRVDACLAPAGGLDVAMSRIHSPKRLCLTTWQDGTCGPRPRGTPIRAADYEQRTVQVDRAVADVVLPYLTAVSIKEQQPTGAHLAAGLSADALAQLTAEGLRRALRADFGLQNRGGVRTAVAAGLLRYGDIFRAVPFDNHAVQITMSGRQIRRLVTRVAHHRPERDWPKLSGLAIHRAASGSLLVDTAKGEPLKEDGLYTLATTDFILAGGDGAEGVFADVPLSYIQLAPTTLRDSLVDLLVALYPEGSSTKP